jgi:SAM-dependent methyltransferase
MRRTQGFYQTQYEGSDYAGASYSRRIAADLTAFVRDQHLEGARVLDVGCGRGFLQDVVALWIGLDLSENAGRYAAKPFICAAAEQIPFRVGAFDLVWSVNFLEHSPDPEAVLGEIHRVLKPGGIVYLSPTWRVPPWRPQAYELRSYASLNVRGKATKLLLPLINFLWQRGYSWIPRRLLRELWFKIRAAPLALRYKAFAPNLHAFLLPDSDACASIDNHEVLLWLRSRGFRELEPRSMWQRALMPSGPVVLVKGSPTPAPRRPSATVRDIPESMEVR